MYKIGNDKLERNLSGTCTILSNILENIFILPIAKRRTRPVFAFNLQNKTEHSTRSGRLFGCVLHVESFFLRYLYRIDQALHVNDFH